MSIFNNGGGELKSTNKPAAFWEIFNKLQEAEQQIALAMPQLASIAAKTALTVDVRGKAATFSASVPLLETIGAAGEPTFSGFNYLSAAQIVIPNIGDFNPGTGGDLHATNLAAALLEMAVIIRKADSAIVATVATQQPNTVTITYDNTAMVANVTGTIPVSPTVDQTTGELILQAEDYLP